MSTEIPKSALTPRIGDSFIRNGEAMIVSKVTRYKVYLDRVCGDVVDADYNNFLREDWSRRVKKSMGISGTEYVPYVPCRRRRALEL